MEEALRRLGVGASYVVFGHTHRAGPRPGDDLGEWRMKSGGQLVNAGCWVSDPRLDSQRPASPYRPGYAVWLAESGPPEVVNLLD
jgi:hypothetical protein